MTTSEPLNLFPFEHSVSVSHCGKFVTGHVWNTVTGDLWWENYRCVTSDRTLWPVDQGGKWTVRHMENTAALFAATANRRHFHDTKRRLGP